MRSNRVRTATLVVVTVGVVAAIATTLIGVVLADLYRPHAPFADLSQLNPATRRSAEWSDRHQWVGFGFVATTALGLALVAWLRVPTRALTRPAMTLAASAVAAMAALVWVATLGPVQWDQLGLWSVTVGTDVDGYWTAAFGTDVRFVLVGGAEVSQGEYATALVAHLGAPVVGLVALLVVGFTVRSSPMPATDTALHVITAGTAPAT